MSREVFTHSERRFRTLVEHSTDAIALLTPEGIVTYASASIERILGYTPQEFMTINGLAVFHSDDSPMLAHAVQHLLAISGLVETHQVRSRHKDGSWRWVEATVTNLVDDPDVQALVVNLHDISERKQAEVKLKAHAEYIEESEQRFRLLADNAPVMIWTSGIDKLCTYFNAPWLAFTGRTMAQELGNGWAEGVHQADREHCLAMYAAAFDARTPFSMDYRLRRHDGQYRWILDNGIPFYAPDGTFTGYIGSCIDITERRGLEQQLQYSERKLRSLVDSNIFGVVVVDLDGRIYECNDRYAQIVGYSRDELLAQACNWIQFVPPEDHAALRQAMATVLSAGAMPPYERGYLHKDGSIVPALVAATLLDRERRLVLSVILDISEQKAAERRKQEFLSMVSHELRTPLTSIMGFIELALLCSELLPGPLSPEAEKMLGQIVMGLRRATGQVEIEARLVEELLEVSRLELHKFELSLHRENLVTIVQETVASQQQAAPTRQIELILPLEEVVLVFADAGRIGQALTNYLTNALKYAPVEQPIMVRLEVEASSARVAVRDQGPGLTPEQQRRVWERFYQVADPGRQGPEGGLGLGLAIAKAIVEQHQGQVGVESVPGHGATFWFTLPIEASPQE